MNLAGARIGGALDCSRGRFEVEEGDALNCNAIRVGADVFLSDGFVAKWHVGLGGAEIGGQLSCHGGRIEVKTGDALNCNAILVAAPVFLQDGFVAKGGVDLTRGVIEGNLQCSNASVEGSILAPRLKVGVTLFWTEMKGGVPLFNLEDATLGELDDDAASWDIVARHQLDGLTYDSIGPNMAPRVRLNWLNDAKGIAQKDA